MLRNTLPPLASNDSASLLQEPVHDVCIHEPEFPVPVRLGQRSDDGESQFLVERDRGRVGADDVVELHRPVPGIPRQPQAVFDEGSPDTLALRVGMDQVGRARDVRPTAGVIRSPLIHSDDARPDPRGIGRVVTVEPTAAKVVFGRVFRKRQRVTGGD